MHPRSSNPPTVIRRAFSLVEVVIALGIFAFAIVAIVGMLGPIGNSVSEVRDRDDASRLVSVVQEALKREFNRVGYAVFDTYIVDTVADADPDGIDGVGDTVLFASRSGDKIGPMGVPAIWNPDGLPPADQLPDEPNEIGDRYKFFEIILLRNDSLSPVGSDNGFLAFTLRLSWPAYAPNGAKIADAERTVLLIPTAITR